MSLKTNTNSISDQISIFPRSPFLTNKKNNLSCAYGQNCIGLPLSYFKHKYVHCFNMKTIYGTTLVLLNNILRSKVNSKDAYV